MLIWDDMTEEFAIGKQILSASEIPGLLGRYQLMQQFIREKIVDGAIADLTCTAAEREQAIEKFCQQHNLNTPEAKNEWLGNQLLTPEQLEEIAVRSLLIEKYKVATWGLKVESYFLKRKFSLDMVYYSLIRMKDEGLAKEIYFRIQEGEESFADMARQYSQGPEANTGGYIGPAPVIQPHPVISQLLSVSQPGQLWAPRPLAEWFIIIRLEQYIPAQLDEAMRQRMIDEMFVSWLNEQQQQVGLMRSLTSSSSISP